jgi:two-component system, NtrC family, sensor histidine kinase KinB
MRIKTKLLLGVGFLFAMILLLGIVATRQITRLSADADRVLESNYNSLVYANNMLRSLNGSLTVEDLRVFRQNLDLQIGNITEPGEKEISLRLKEKFLLIQQGLAEDSIKSLLRSDLDEIVQLNLDSIAKKNAIAGQTAQQANFWIVLVGTLCFIVAFTLLFNLPSNIANPIRQLTESIREIAARNYGQRLHFSSSNEFGELARSFNVMAQKLEEYNGSNLAVLMKEKRRVETLINNMRDPVIGLDEREIILFVNDEAAAVSGLRKDLLVGKRVDKVMEANDLMRNLFDEIKGQVSLKIYANGKESYFEKEVHPIYIVPTAEEQEQYIGKVMVLRNVTPYKELDLAKTNFIATVSHEYKTPISAINLSLRLLENPLTGNLNEEQAHLVKSIREDAGRLLKITSELLNMSQVESGNIQMHLQPASLETIVNLAVEANQMAAGEKRVRIDIATPEQWPAMLADSEKSVWVLSNILSNAIRYSYTNSDINLEVTVDAEWVKLSVTDHGQGIATEYQTKIFDRYFRIPGTRKEGTGLGLAISKDFMEAQGGRITLESELGKGSTFILWWKCAG